MPLPFMRAATTLLQALLHGAAADRQPFVSVALVVHALTIRFEVVDLALQQVSIVVAVGFAQQIEFVTVRPPYKPIPPLTENCCLLLHDVDTLVKLM